MVNPTFISVSFSILLILCDATRNVFYWDYIVIGAGPGGLQLGYYLEKENRDYMILERNGCAGSFFEIYPRHDTLISINKRSTGEKNKEFNLRHDWNSLLSHDESLLFRHYSEEMFPPRESLFQYLKDFQKKLGIKVKFNVDINDIKKHEKFNGHEDVFSMQDQTGNIYLSRYLILATGLSSPNTLNVNGSELIEYYDNVSTNKKDFVGQNVLILGNGNAAFEVADHIYGKTSLIHLVGRHRIRLAWATHYVGDLRGVNNAVLDTYQLKSLDGIDEFPFEKILKFLKTEEGKIRAVDKSDDVDIYGEQYDRVIGCLGWSFDSSLFQNQSGIVKSVKSSKYPTIKHNFESSTTNNLYFTGTNTHGLDRRKSSGGFIHGFRYTARTLHHLLEWKNHQVQWPHIRIARIDLKNHIIKRINEVSSMYQMFGVLGDLYLLDKDDVIVLEDFPIGLVHDLENMSGHKWMPAIMFSFEYGTNFSGPNADVFHSGRVHNDPAEAYKSNFLHPLFYYYKDQPTERDINRHASKLKTEDKPPHQQPTPHQLHFMPEDFLAKWVTPKHHIIPLRKFLQDVFQEDLRHFSSENCFHYAMTLSKLPAGCDEFIFGRGLQIPEKLSM